MDYFDKEEPVKFWEDPIQNGQLLAVFDLYYNMWHTDPW